MNNQFRVDIDRTLAKVFADVEADLGLDEQGMVSVAFAGDVVVTLEVPRTSVHLYAHAPLFHLLRGDPAPMMEEALALNLFHAALPSAWVGLDKDTSTLLLCACLHAGNCGEKELTEFLETFVASVPLTRERLRQGRDTEGARASDPARGDVILIHS